MCMGRFFWFVLKKTIATVGTSISAAVKKIQAYICMMNIYQYKNIFLLKCMKYI